MIPQRPGALTVRVVVVLVESGRDSVVRPPIPCGSCVRTMRVNDCASVAIVRPPVYALRALLYSECRSWCCRVIANEVRRPEIGVNLLGEFVYGCVEKLDLGVVYLG